MSTTHDLKIEPRFLGELLDGTKTYELRRNDRDYRVGDMLHFRHDGYSYYFQVVGIGTLERVAEGESLCLDCLDQYRILSVRRMAF